ncbi:NAD(P)H-dependent oxidoreductase [Halobacteriovorax sp. GB3]|uniref:NAD(P)H-dependent oxidoreductase n=1 Tax=Halobacteriovorax sp. GB3 TaxID=2719615 RepID=UPI00236042F4|nr:NAD(P)H-dependent oxidoreductase [Halobacteriovorax sp. GB3]MDD0852972.1 NAD(P)H-dependent oxidoreductase [Halobacteriovorax sp. GB3]
MNVLIIDANPNKKSLTTAIATRLYDKYQREHQCRLIHLSDLDFDLSFQGYSDKKELGPDLVKAQLAIKEADHLIFATPIWWSSIPALFKGFLDRCLTPHFAFSYKENSPFQNKLLKNKTADLYLLSDAPAWYRKFILGDPAAKMLKRDTLEFCGIKVKKVKRIGNVRNLNREQAQRILESL